MRLAFVVDGFTSHAGVLLRQDADGVVHGEVQRGDADLSAVELQVRRILSLDHSGREFLKVGKRDPVIGRLQTRFPGLRPVLFNSPYEAAAWAVLSQRRRRPQAMNLRRELSTRRPRRARRDGMKPAEWRIHPRPLTYPRGATRVPGAGVPGAKGAQVGDTGHSGPR